MHSAVVGIGAERGERESEGLAFRQHRRIDRLGPAGGRHRVRSLVLIGPGDAVPRSYGDALGSVGEAGDADAVTCGGHRRFAVMAVIATIVMARTSAVS